MASSDSNMANFLISLKKDGLSRWGKAGDDVLDTILFISQLKLLLLKDT
jgi:hypothetical protein